jgi:hypothetical protein
MASPNNLKFYIDGAWVDPVERRPLDVINPATEQPVAQISLGGAADVDRAVKAARAAFPAYSRTTKAERIALLERIVEAYKARYDDIAKAISQEMGAPTTLATKAQAATGVGHLKQMIAVLGEYEFEHMQGKTRIIREPIGVCGFITPWNWPINQITCKVAPALAAGCTMVLKPSEIAPLNAIIFAEVLHAAGVPKGVFNLVNGDGATVGQAIAVIRAWIWCPSPAPPGPASWWPRPRPTPSSACTRSWAASRPTSSCPTPISRRRWRTGCAIASATAASPATRPLACSCPAISTRTRSRWPARRRRA